MLLFGNILQQPDSKCGDRILSSHLVFEELSVRIRLSGCWRRGASKIVGLFRSDCAKALLQFMKFLQHLKVAGQICR